jgi:hypothetical protein
MKLRDIYSCGLGYDINKNDCLVCFKADEDRHQCQGCIYLKHNIHELQNFFNNVKIKLGFYDWKIRFNCAENYCWVEDKRIDINLVDGFDPYKLILHEIAHIDTAKYCNQKHNYDFYKKLRYLYYKFLNRDLKINNDKEIKNVFSIKYNYE